MKTKLVLLFFLASSTGFAQQDFETLVPFLSGSSYGFSDESGKLVLPARYDLAYPFYSSHALSFVITNGKPMIINRKGKKVAEAVPDYLSEAEDDSMTSLYRSKQETVSIDSYCLADSCPEFVIYRKPLGNQLLDQIGPFYSVRANSKVFLIDAKGKPKTNEYDRIRHIKAGEIEYALTEDYTTKKTGLLDHKGEMLLECVYDEISYLGKGQFDLKQSGKSWTYKTAYNQAYQPSDLPVKEFMKNRYLSRRDGKFGLTDSLKNCLLPFVFDKLYPMGQDNYLFRKRDTVGIITIQGAYLFKTPITQDESKLSGSRPFISFVPYTSDMAFINDGKYWNLVTTRGILLQQKLDGISIDFQKYAGNIAGICANHKVGLIDNRGNVILEMKYDKLFCLPDNQSYVARLDDKWVWLDSRGSVIVNNFDDFRYVLQGYLLIFKNNKWYFTGSNGKEFVK